MRFLPVLLTTSLVSVGFAVPGGHSVFGSHLQHPITTQHIIHGVKSAPIECHVIDTRLFPVQIDTSTDRAPKEHEQPIPPLKFNGSTGSSVTSPLGASNLNEIFKINARYPGIGPTGWVPPDPNIACGLNYLVETVNDHVAFFSKSNGSKLFEQSFGNFFSTLNNGNTGTFLFDPKAMFDKVSGRFFFTADNLDGNNSFIDVAVSQTSNPNGQWNLYKVSTQTFSGGSNYWLDYPSLACSTDGVALTGNMFPLGNGGFGGVQFIVLPKAPMLAGTAVTPTALLDTSEGSAQVARSWEPNQTTIYGLDLAGNSAMRVYAILNPATNPVLQYTDVSMPSFTYPEQNALSTDGHELDTLGDRILNCYQRNGHLMCGHSVQASSGDRGRSVARWEMFSINGWPASGNQPAYLQGGNIDTGPNDDDIQPAINENYLGDVSVCFTRCSPSIVDDIMFTSRKPADPLGSTSVPQKLIGSTTDYGGQGFNRWGDFFDVSIDPTDDTTFWGIGEIADSSGNWQTYFFNWSVSSQGSLANTFNATAVSVKEGTYTAGNLSSLNQDDGNKYAVSSVVYPGESAASVVVTYNVGDVSSFTQMQLDVDASFTGSPITRFVYAYNYAKRQFELINSSPGSQTGSISVPIPHFAEFVQNGQMKLIIRGAITVRHGTPFPFTMNVDQAVVSGQ